MKNKKIIIFQIVAFLAIAVVLVIVGSSNKASGGKSWSKTATDNENPADKVEVIYFYSSARCASCIALEEFTERTINNNFQDKMNSGEVTFNAYNVEEQSNVEIVNKYRARGSSLFINTIYDGNDHIKEEVNVWRYLSSESQFSNYLTNKINSYFGE